MGVRVHNWVVFATAVVLATCTDSDNPPPHFGTVDTPRISDREARRVRIGGQNFFSRVVRYDLKSAVEVDVLFSVAIDDQVLDADSVRWIDPENIEIELPAGLPLGLRDATVTIPDGRSSTLVDAFNVLPCFADDCGDGCCLGMEDEMNCPADCEETCGDGLCQPPEDEMNCPADCEETCGDGMCLGNETSITCSIDCLPRPFCNNSLSELIACFEFEEGSGATVLVDGSSAGNNASVQNAIFVPGIAGSALQGSNDFDVKIAESNSLDVEDALTIEAWIQPDASISVSRQGIFDNEGQYGFFVNATNALRCTAAGLVALSANEVVVSGEWQHVACVYDSTALRIYLNGVSVAETTGTGTIATGGTEGSSLGQNNPDGNQFIGKLDQIRIWSTGRSKAQLCASNGLACP